MKVKFPWLDEGKFQFALDRIYARAATPPNSDKYWLKALSNFFENWDSERGGP